MAIKVEVTEGTQQKEISFPVLMKDTESGLIVLFISEQEGIVVKTDGQYGWKLGNYSKAWVSCKHPSEWIPFEGTISISNE